MVTGYLRSLKSLERVHNQPGRRFYRTRATITASRAASFIMIYNCIEFTIREISTGLRREIIAHDCSFDRLKTYWREEIIRAHYQDRLFQGTNHVELLKDVAAFVPGRLDWKSDLQRIPFNGNVDHVQLARFIKRIEHRWRPPPSSLGGADLYLVRQMRNDLAHGLETFEDVGASYQTQDIVDKFERIKKYMFSLIKALERYRVTRSFIN